MLFTLPVSAEPELRKEEPLGMGLLTGPGFFSFKQFRDYDHTKAVDIAVGVGNYFYIHADYLFNRPRFDQTENAYFDYYTGVGLRVINRENEDRVRTGIRFPAGMSMFFKTLPVEVFGELSMTLDIVPEPRSYLDLGLGARYYFDLK